MKGVFRTVRANNHVSKTNFDDWSDPKYRLPLKSEHPISHDKSTEILEVKSNNLDGTVISDTTLEINDMKEKIMKGEPLMSKKEIRNFRLPFYESLLLNLKEDGYILSYEFIKDLIAVDDAYHKELETNFNLKNRPILKNTESILIPLSHGLIKAETSKLNGEKNQELTAFLELAIFFSKSGDPSYYWIAMEMFEQCMDVISNVEKSVDKHLQANARYLYGLFLFNELHKLQEAKAQTELAMKLSEGKSWSVGESKEKNKTLYIECCILLHKIYLALAEREMVLANTDQAIQLCRNGLLWAKMMNSKRAEADALRKLINIYLSAQQVFSVPELLESYMKLSSELEDFEGLCEGYILQARYHDIVGDHTNVIKNMNDLLHIAKEHGIMKMIGIAHHKLATYSLMRGAEQDLLEHAVEAYMSHLNYRKNVKDIEEARCLVGVAQGLEILTEYCNLVLDADNKNFIDQSVLIRWKNLRIAFFDKNFVLISEISANAQLLDKLEAKRAEEFLANFNKRQTELVTMSSRRSSEVSSVMMKQVSLLRSRHPSISGSSGSNLKSSVSFNTSQERRGIDRTESGRSAKSTKTIDSSSKLRTVNFVEDSHPRELRSVSVIMENHQ